MTRRNHSDLKVEGRERQNVKMSAAAGEELFFFFLFSLNPLYVASLFEADVLFVGCKIAINCNAACHLSEMEVF